MSSTPTVPQIADISTPQASTSGGLDQLLGQVAKAAQGPLPSPYSVGTDVAQPTLPQVRQAPVMNANQAPITGQVADVKHARRQNAVAGLINAVNSGAQQIQQRKQDNLKERLKDVMQAKQNVANAQSVLQQDPNNKMAKGVMDANKKRLNDILSDPKHTKELQKALDISFVDPSANKTPEIQAFQAAHKEVQQAGVFNASNPQEAQVAKLAQGSGQAQPVPAAQVHAGPPNPQQQAQAPKSTTPYADKALSRDMPSIQANPAYAPAVAQQQAAQKALYTNVLPAAIRAESAQQLEQIKQGNANARAQFKATTDFQMEARKQVDKMAQLSQTAKAAMARTIQTDSAAMARTTLEVNSRLKIAEDKRLDPTAKNKLQTEALSQIDKSITAITSERANLSTQMANAKNNPDEQRTIQTALDYNALKLEATNLFRQQTATKIYGSVVETNPNGGSSETDKNTGVTAVGADDSDDDSDDYGTGDS